MSSPANAAESLAASSAPGRWLAAPHVERKGAVLEAGGNGLRWLEWSVAEDGNPENLRAVCAANPLRTLAEMREQRARVSEIEWLQFHAGMWGVGSARWLPAGAWQGDVHAAVLTGDTGRCPSKKP
jgi:hypothetical protein